MSEIPVWLLDAWFICGIAQMLLAAIAFFRDQHDKCRNLTLSAFVWFYLAVNLRG